MNQKVSVIFWISIVFLVLLIGFFSVYSLLFTSDKGAIFSGYVIKNPVEGLTDKQALVAFNESFIFYLLYELKAYNLHNPPLSSDIPKIEIRIGNEVYNSVVEKGVIKVKNGEISNEDVIIRITKEEAIKMLRDKNYVLKSFNDKKSSVELVASKTRLFAKGYLSFYNKIMSGNL